MTCSECQRIHDAANAILVEAGTLQLEANALRKENKQLRASANSRVGFSYAKGLGGILSRVIKSITRSPCSHTWLVYFDHDFGTDVVMEAHTTWRLMTLEEFRKRNFVVAVFEPKQPIDAGLKLGGRLLGSRYDFEGLFGMLWVIIGQAIKRKLRNPFRSTRSVFCSEGVVRVLQAADYPGAENMNPNDTSPKDLLLMFETDGSRKVAP